MDGYAVVTSPGLPLAHCGIVPLRLALDISILFGQGFWCSAVSVCHSLLLSLSALTFSLLIL
jgi:hypothetical protein